LGWMMSVRGFALTSSAPQDGQAMLWDLNEGKHLYTLDGGDIINALCFSPNRYWLCAATGPSIKIWVGHRLVLSSLLSRPGSSRRFRSFWVMLGLGSPSWSRSSPWPTDLGGGDECPHRGGPHSSHCCCPWPCPSWLRRVVVATTP